MKQWKASLFPQIDIKSLKFFSIQIFFKATFFFNIDSNEAKENKNPLN